MGIRRLIGPHVPSSCVSEESGGNHSILVTIGFSRVIFRRTAWARFHVDDLVRKEDGYWQSLKNPTLSQKATPKRAKDQTGGFGDASTSPGLPAVASRNAPSSRSTCTSRWRRGGTGVACVMEHMEALETRRRTWQGHIPNYSQSGATPACFQ